MSKVIFSTIGTSLLTKQIERNDPADWLSKLRDSANLKFDKISAEVRDIINTLKERAVQNLKNSSTEKVRLASAELNGIYGIYDEQLEQGNADMHWLVSTDTAQGLETAQIVEDFLRSKGITAQIFTPQGLSAANTADFSSGIDDLLIWIEEAIEGYEKVCFNLVGGFKSLQAYLNSIGMFYADEIIYIFEGANSDLIRIPRLPIKIDESVIEPFKCEFALMAVGAWISHSELFGIPESLLSFAGDECLLSNWGRLVWNRTKKEVLSKNLLDFPRLHYEASFLRDYGATQDIEKRVKLQEVLAKVSYLLNKGDGNTGILKEDGGILYEVYTNQQGIAHFRVTQGIRVSCVAKNSQLHLRHYGTEPEVNRNP